MKINPSPITKLKNQTSTISTFADHAGTILEVMSTQKTVKKTAWTRKSIKYGRSFKNSNEKEKEEKYGREAKYRERSGDSLNPNGDGKDLDNTSIG